MNVLIDELLDNTEALLLEPRDVFDTAILGVANRSDGLMVAAYSTEKCIEALMHQHHWDREKAEEWFYYNTTNAYVGEGSPVFIDLLPQSDNQA